ncbi:hypothetical protein [Kineosporia succinea]|uniref:Uncharacterized protein n=1 Tax=Kineosporia succinea TaxID=84632 RepID=A0ABT9P6F2_9ACTN|nr:hypothetical protein [Kineosporia succinea]MDP9828258.1 hypothetical protein [Kineosporia succinea]
MSHRHLEPGALPPEWGRALTSLQDALATDDDCLVCLGVGALRDHGPDLLDRVSGVAADLARTLRENAPQEPVRGDRGTAPTRRPAPPTTVRIDVSD